MSSAGRVALRKARAPSRRPGYAAKNGDPKAGEGRAYTQNPATAQASAPSARVGDFRPSRRLRNSEGPGAGGTARSGGRAPTAGRDRHTPLPARRSVAKARPALTGLGSSCSGVSRLILKSQKTQFAGGVRSAEPEARSSVVEHYLDTVGGRRFNPARGLLPRPLASLVARSRCDDCLGLRPVVFRRGALRDDGITHDGARAPNAGVSFSSNAESSPTT